MKNKQISFKIRELEDIEALNFSTLSIAQATELFSSAVSELTLREFFSLNLEDELLDFVEKSLAKFRKTSKNFTIEPELCFQVLFDTVRTLVNLIEKEINSDSQAEDEEFFLFPIQTISDIYVEYLEIFLRASFEAVAHFPKGDVFGSLLPLILSAIVNPFNILKEEKILEKSLAKLSNEELNLLMKQLSEMLNSFKEICPQGELSEEEEFLLQNFSYISINIICVFIHIATLKKDVSILKPFLTYGAYIHDRFVASELVFLYHQEKKYEGAINLFSYYVGIPINEMQENLDEIIRHLSHDDFPIKAWKAITECYENGHPELDKKIAIDFIKESILFHFRADFLPLYQKYFKSSDDMWKDILFQIKTSKKEFALTPPAMDSMVMYLNSHKMIDVLNDFYKIVLSKNMLYLLNLKHHGESCRLLKDKYPEVALNMKKVIVTDTLAMHYKSRYKSIAKILAESEDYFANSNEYKKFVSEIKKKHPVSQKFWLSYDEYYDAKIS